MKYFIVVLIAICPALLLYGIFENDNRSFTTNTMDDTAHFDDTTNDLCDEVNELKNINASVPGDLEIFYQSNCNTGSE